MKRKMARKEKEAEEEEKEVLLPSIPVADEKQNDADMCSNGSEEKLLMRIVTWLRDSHSLFDYESRQIQKKNVKIENSCRFLRIKDEVITAPTSEVIDSDPEKKPLFSLK